MVNGRNSLDGSKHFKASNNMTITPTDSNRAFSFKLSRNNRAKVEDQQNLSKGIEEQLFGEEKTTMWMLAWSKREIASSNNSNTNSSDKPCKTHEIYPTRYDANQRAELATMYQDKYCKLTESTDIVLGIPSAASKFVQRKSGKEGNNNAVSSTLLKQLGQCSVGCSDASYRRPLTWPHFFAALMVVIILSSNFGFGSFVTATLAYTQRENNRALPSQTGKVNRMLLLLYPISNFYLFCLPPIAITKNILHCISQNILQSTKHFLNRRK